jgi:hypothetical protein
VVPLVENCRLWCQAWGSGKAAESELLCYDYKPDTLKAISGQCDICVTPERYLPLSDQSIPDSRCQPGFPYFTVRGKQQDIQKKCRCDDEPVEKFIKLNGIGNGYDVRAKLDDAVII